LLSNFRFRLLLVLIFWLVTVVALLTWVGGRQKVDLAFAGGPLGSEGYIVATAIAAELNAGDSNFRISVFETGGSSESKLLLETGQIDIASLQADTAVPEEVRSIARLFPDAYHLVVNTSAGIKHFSDLRGHRVAIPPAASAQNASFWFLADHYRIQAEDFQARPMAADAANFAMLEGQVDAVFRVRAPGNPRIRELIGANEMEIVPIEQAEALSLKQPALSPGNIPRGSYRGYPPLPRDNLPTAVLDRILVTRADLPANVIFELTESIFEARSALVARSPLAGFISSLDADNSIPLHPGARQYYDREKPGVIQQNARLASALLYLLVLVGSGVIAVRSRWMRARNQRITDINERLMEIAEATRATENVQELSAYKNQLMDILREVVVDLDKNLVSQKEFEHFSFAWQAVDALVRDQMAIADRLELQLTQETAR
jgi:TRAP transporter TAXI family solute receptor